jgi:catechol 2,3-dioxygenase-like lactoylglutathione lyase family enzyme
MNKAPAMRLLLLLAVFAAVLSTRPVFAQLAPFNNGGVTNGHMHFLVRDPELHKKIWIEVFGAEVANFGRLETLKVPGVFVLLIKGEPTGGSAGSTVDHIGMVVKDLAQTKAKLAAENIQVSDDTPFVTLPDGIRMELREDKELGVPAAFDYIQFVTSDAEKTRAWYVKTFGATVSKPLGKMLAATFPAGRGFPGTTLYFRTQPDAEIAPTKGRAIDHISFEVKDLKAFCERLAAEGIKLDMAIVDAPQIGLKVTFVTDPYGTRIELTQGFAEK